MRKTVRFAQEASSASSSSVPAVSPEYPASGEKQARPRPFLVQNSSHVDDNKQISALDALHEKEIEDDKSWKLGKVTRRA